jgi:LysM repeat protein
MRRIISALLLCFSSAWALAQDPQPIELAPNAPDRHIVVPGDTLWGIAAQFLKDPYRWPDVWRLNPDEIKNPHRIYPGQVVILDKSGDRPLLKLGKLVRAEPRVYAETPQTEIPAIPQHVIEPFLAQPLVIEAGALDNAARIVAIREGRVNVAPGDSVFATQVNSKSTQWHIFRPGKAMRDPDRVDPDEPGEVLGVEAIFLGTARLIQEGEPATLEITSAREEIGRNDYLLPAGRGEIVSYVPHAPTAKIRGRIIGLYGGVGEGGRLSIVSLSRGKKDGLEVGHVLSINRASMYAANRDRENKKELFALPEERYGALFVFRVFDRVSYGLVMQAARPVVAGDIVRTP